MSATPREFKYSHIESRPDDFWMNSVEESGYYFNTNGKIKGLSFLRGINPHWPSQRGTVKKLGWLVVIPGHSNSYEFDSPSLAKWFALAHNKFRQIGIARFDAVKDGAYVVDRTHKIWPETKIGYPSFDPMI